MKTTTNSQRPVPFQQTVYCNTVYRETRFTQLKTNKNNKNRLNLHRRSLWGQWFSILPEQGAGHWAGGRLGSQGCEGGN